MDEDMFHVPDLILSAAAVLPVPVALPTSEPAAAATPSHDRSDHQQPGSLASSSTILDAYNDVRSEHPKPWDLGCPGTNMGPT
eukprot:1377890-Karenia_brevis.AAC.1